MPTDSNRIKTVLTPSNKYALTTKVIWNTYHNSLRFDINY